MVFIPVLAIFPFCFLQIRNSSNKSYLWMIPGFTIGFIPTYINLTLAYENIHKVSISTIGDSEIKPTITIMGEYGNINLVFNNTFQAFKSALLSFIVSIYDKKPTLDNDILLEAIKLIELGISL